MKLKIIHFSVTSLRAYSLFIRPKNSSRVTLFKYSGLSSSLNIRDKVSHPRKTVAGNMTQCGPLVDTLLHWKWFSHYVSVHFYQTQEADFFFDTDKKTILAEVRKETKSHNARMPIGKAIAFFLKPLQILRYESNIPFWKFKKIRRNMVGAYFSRKEKFYSNSRKSRMTINTKLAEKWSEGEEKKVYRYKGTQRKRICFILCLFDSLIRKANV
jgi:hypothetical protein